jgi:hypothetical protein
MAQDADGGMLDVVRNEEVAAVAVGVGPGDEQLG